jgi:type IV pilus assembly protein PilW
MMFNASQRQGISSGGAAIGSSTAMTVLRDDLAAAGLGFFGDSQFLCSRLNLSVGTTKLLDDAEFTPVEVTAEGNNSRIDVVYATEVTSGTNVLLDAPSEAGSAALRSLLPVNAGQAVLLAPETPGASPCTVRTVTANTAATFDKAQLIEYGNDGSAKFNRAAFAVTPLYPDKGRVTLLGDLRWSRYRLDGTNLVLQRPLGGDDVVLARNVMALRAEYGLADEGKTALAAWQVASGASWASLDPARLARVRALRVGIVTRGAQPEKPNNAGECEATPVLPQLFGDDIAPDVADWKCYRFRTAVVVVPLRNLVLGTAK